MRRILVLWFFIVAVTTSSSAAAFQTEATPGPDEQPPEGPELLFEVKTDDDLGYFRVEAEPGDRVELTIQMGNSGTETATLRTYSADAFTLENGGFGLNDSTMPVTSPTTWLDYPTEEITFEPGTGIDRTFTVAIPEGALPGQYITGIALETVEATPLGDQDSAVNFSVIKRSARAVFITVPGPIESGMSLGDVRVSQDSTGFALAIGVSNTGNILLNPAGTIQIADAAGAVIVASPVQMGTVYAGHVTTLSIALAQPLPAGDYTVSVTLEDKATGASAEFPDAPFAIEAAGSADPVLFVSASVTPRPSADSVQLAEVTAVIGNSGDPLSNLQVTLHVSRDGELVESFPIATSLALPFGDTAVQNRYLPLEGWSSGNWTFSLTLDQIDPSSGTSQQIATYDIESTIEIP